MQELKEVHAEDICDVVLLLGFLAQMDLPGLLDQHLARYQREQRLSLGWTITIWLAYLVSQGDHRKLTVRDWVRSMHHTLAGATGQRIEPVDFTDDRLTIALHHLSNQARWKMIEEDLAQHLIRVYDLSQDTIRADATTVSGHREGGEGSLWQFGHSKDDPTLRQVKVMMSSLDPLGLPLATDVVSGQSADDPLYVPILERTFAALKRKKGLLVVGDCKMSALATRAYIHKMKHHYLMPLPQTGEVATKLASWVAEFWMLRPEERITVSSDAGGTGEAQPIARGYVRERKIEHEGRKWEEHIFVVQSFAHAESQRRSLEARITKAILALLALTPPVGRGRRQIRAEDQLKKRADAILKQYQVEGLITYQYERQSRVVEKLVGRGRDGPNREHQLVEVDVRYQITAVSRNTEAVAAAQARASVGGPM